MRHFMPTQTRKAASTKGSFDKFLMLAAQVAAILVGLFAFTVMLDHGQVLIAPVTLALVVGLMFGPLADRIERAGVPAPVSAAAVVLAFLALISAVLATIVIPLSAWTEKIPVIWVRAQAILADWKDLLTTLDSMSDSMRNALGQSGQAASVKVEGSSTAESVAWLAPTLGMQIILFLASLYFFMATRHQLRFSVLGLCFDRRLRWRIAHVFRDVESLVSHYLMSITAINMALGAFVSVAMALLGVPSPLLWGVLAGLLNYAIYVGPAIMAVILLGVGLATASTPTGYLAPMAVYLALNMIEAQIVTPHVLGRTLTLNPFIVLLAIAFWIWVWGPVGGFVAVPLLLMATAAVRHVSPQNHRRYAIEANAEKN
ncbi:AI-2E family transporter [Zhengella mangrovi]|nr:AI-2E family transporter [Zhengella mangrovi]